MRNNLVWQVMVNLVITEFVSAMKFWWVRFPPPSWWTDSYQLSGKLYDENYAVL